MEKQLRTKQELARMIADQLQLEGLEGAPVDRMTINITPDMAYGWRVVVMGDPARLPGAQSHADRLAEDMRRTYHLLE